VDSDRQTAELLRKVNATNTPSFHNYGGRPPRTVLDLGCGAGHWMLDAAMAWRNSGTQIIGFDMVDTTKGMWPVAQRQGIVDNIKFVRGNLCVICFARRTY
jgi:ubiquinone/menaquinone biosynthesis C-methylase UbiE